MKTKNSTNTPARTLLAAQVIGNLRAQQMADLDEKPQRTNNDNDGSTYLKKRFTLQLSMGLVRRITDIGRLPGAQKTPSFSNEAKNLPYEISCARYLSIHCGLARGLDALHEFPVSAPRNRPDVVFFVLWALSDTVPLVFKKLTAQKVGANTSASPAAVSSLTVPVAYKETDPPFVFRRGAFLDRTEIHPSELGQVLGIGATGSGKSYSLVMPLLESFIAYSNAQGKRMGMLLVDPKGELLPFCIAELKALGQEDRLVRLGEGCRVKFFSEQSQLSLEDRYRKLAGMFAIKTNGDGSLWQQKGGQLSIDMATLDRKFEIHTGVRLWGVVRSLIDGKDHSQASQWENICAIYSYAIESKRNLEWITIVSTVLLRLCPDLQKIESVFNKFSGDPEMANQLFYRVSNAELVCKILAAKEVTSVINTDLFPKDSPNDWSVAELIDAEKIIVHQPAGTYSGDIAGRLLKSRFFADALERPDMLQPLGYIVDEFQNYITSDRETGEQSFIDRCRSYRVNCVLVTQSMASIELALAKQGEELPKLVINILAANTATKLIFRTSDDGTYASLKGWIPAAPIGHTHIVDVRHPALLPVGTAYYLCDGGWGVYEYKRISA